MSNLRQIAADELLGRLSSEQADQARAVLKALGDYIDAGYTAGTGAAGERLVAAYRNLPAGVDGYPIAGATR